MMLPRPCSSIGFENSLITRKKPRTYSRPIPRAPPVTRTTLPAIAIELPPTSFWKKLAVLEDPLPHALANMEGLVLAALGCRRNLDPRLVDRSVADHPIGIVAALHDPYVVEDQVVIENDSSI